MEPAKTLVLLFCATCKRLMPHEPKFNLAEERWFVCEKCRTPHRKEAAP